MSSLVSAILRYSYDSRVCVLTEIALMRAMRQLVRSCFNPSENGSVCGEVVNGTPKQVRALRIIRITAQGKI